MTVGRNDVDDGHAQVHETPRQDGHVKVRLGLFGQGRQRAHIDVLHITGGVAGHGGGVARYGPVGRVFAAAQVRPLDAVLDGFDRGLLDLVDGVAIPTQFGQVIDPAQQRPDDEDDHHDRHRE